jgi:hypothetical protein
METYRHPGGISGTLHGHIVDAGHAVLAPWCEGARHVEAFSPLAA